MDRAVLVEKIEGIRRLMSADTISQNFRETHVVDRIMSLYEDAGAPRENTVVCMTLNSFSMAIRNERNTPEEVADRLLEALEFYDDR